jgi:hypothetical protein
MADWGELKDQDAFEEEMIDCYERLPGYDVLQLSCPANPANDDEGKSCYPRDLHSTIMHLNDRHKWSRERIADWVESLEEYVDLEFK